MGASRLLNGIVIVYCCVCVSEVVMRMLPDGFEMFTSTTQAPTKPGKKKPAPTTEPEFEVKLIPDGDFKMFTSTDYPTQAPKKPVKKAPPTKTISTATPVPAMPGTFEMVTEETTTTPLPTEPDIPGTFEMVTEETTIPTTTPVPAMPGTFEMVTEETTTTPLPTEPDIPGTFEMVTEEPPTPPPTMGIILGPHEMITSEPPPLSPLPPPTMGIILGPHEMITSEPPPLSPLPPPTMGIILGPHEMITSEPPPLSPLPPPTMGIILGPHEMITSEPPPLSPLPPPTMGIILGPHEMVTEEPPPPPSPVGIILGPHEMITSEPPPLSPLPPPTMGIILGPHEMITSEPPPLSPLPPPTMGIILGPHEMITSEPPPLSPLPPPTMGIILGTHEMITDTTTDITTTVPTTGPGNPMAAAALADGFVTTTEATTTATTTTAAPNVTLSHQEMKTLFDLLLTNYDTRARPRQNQMKSVKLYSKFVPKSIIRFDTQEQKFSVMGYFKVEWWDQLMRWEPDEHAGAKRIKVPAGEIWTPNLVIGKAFDGVNVIGQNKSDIVLVHYKGYVQWVPEGIYSFVCQVDIQFYPYDIQTCALTYFVSGETNDRVNHTYFGQVDSSEFLPNSEWELLSVESKMREKKNLTYVDIIFKIKRRGEFAIFTVIAPLLMLSFLNGCVFLVPVGSGEKGSFAITVFLAYGVFVTIVIDNLPHNSLNVSYFVLYITSLLALSVILVVYTVIQAKMYMSIGSLQCKLGIPTRWTSSVAPQDQSLVPDTSVKKPVYTWAALLKKLDTWMFVIFASVVVADTCLFMVVVENNINVF